MLAIVTMARNASADRYLPSTISQSWTGDDVSSTSVPVCRSSAIRRIEMKTLAMQVVPNEM